MRKGTLSWCLMVALGMSLGLAACGDDGDDDDDMGMGDDDDDMGAVRVWHLAPDAGDVDVFVNGSPLIPGFEFEGNTQFTDLPAGSYDFAVAPAGAGIDAAVITVDGFDLGADESWTIIAIQVDQDPMAAGAFQALAVQQEAELPPAGDIQMQVFHASFLVGNAVDVYDADSPAAPVVSGIAQGTVADAIEVPNGAYTLALDITDPPDGALDLTAAAPLDMPTDQAQLLIGVLSKPEKGEVETEVVFIVNDTFHEEIELEGAE